MTSHFYWVGAIPAMVFVAVFMMPFYHGSKARSVPESGLTNVIVHSIAPEVLQLQRTIARWDPMP